MQSPRDVDGEIETALLDADLFLKYRAPERALQRLRTALERHPRSVELRERVREIVISSKYVQEAARQCLALASLYIEREDFDTAHQRLLEAKDLDPRISIARGLEAIRRARRPDLQPIETPTKQRPHTLSGDLSAISLFDIVQVIENARLTGILLITDESRSGRLFFNEGLIVGAEAADVNGQAAFTRIVEITGGTFDFERSPQKFPITLNTTSNTSLILDALRQLDEENK